MGKAFASAKVQSESSAALRALTPATLLLIGRSLIRRGELVLYLDTSAGRIDLLPCQSHDVQGGPNPMTWEYRCSVSGPERTYTYERTPAAGVVHLTYSVEAETPWRGRGPLQSAGLTGRLASEVMAALGDEASGPRGHLLGIPVDGGDVSVEKLRADLRNMAGKLALMETGDWNNAGSAMTSLKPERVGATPGAALVELYKLSRLDVLAACGINPALMEISPGVSMREAYREFLFSTGDAVMPGHGRTAERPCTAAERDALDNAADVLGETTFDVHLNGKAHWRNVPAAVWNYELGGYQVLKKWLSYREHKVLGRNMHLEEVEHFMHTARRIAAILMLTARP